ncbi:hypothetical protein YC2023_121292 [Brassica napus]
MAKTMQTFVVFDTEMSKLTKTEAATLALEKYSHRSSSIVNPTTLELNMRYGETVTRTQSLQLILNNHTFKVCGHKFTRASTKRVITGTCQVL